MIPKSYDHWKSTEPDLDRDFTSQPEGPQEGDKLRIEFNLLLNIREFLDNQADANYGGNAPRYVRKKAMRLLMELDDETKGALKL